MNNKISVIEKYPNLGSVFDDIGILKEKHYECFRSLNGDSDKNIFMFDLFLKPILKRSLDLCDSFIILLNKWHFAISASLLRMQLDSLLRAFYVAQRTDKDDFIRNFQTNESFHKLKHIDGKVLTDKLLIELASKQYTWVANVYRETSNLIHLSTKHHTSTITEIDNKNRTITEIFTIGFPNWPEQDIRESLECFREITAAIINIINTWNNQKL